MDPIAYVYRPKRVWASTMPSTIATASATSTRYGIPATRPMPNFPTRLNGTSRSSTPPVISSAAPSDIPSVPSVTMKAGIFALAISKPLKTPHANPEISAATSPSRITPRL